MIGKYGPSIYCATDKNVYDALHNKRISDNALLNYLLNRGIIASPKASRESLISQIAMLPFDYRNHLDISTRLESHSIKDNLTNTRLVGDMSVDDIESAATLFKKNICDPGDHCDVSRKNDVVKIEIRYTEIDFSKTELAQRSNKVSYIEISKDEGGDGFLVRYSDTEKAENACSKIIDAISKGQEKEVQEFSISLRLLEDPEARTYFFDQLCRYMDGYKLDDVTGVDVHRSKLVKDDADVDVDHYIDKAKLKGKGVLNSKEFDQLTSMGFYTYYLAWTVIPQNGIDDKVEFEAKFKDPEQCERFTYAVKGIYRKNGASYNKTHKPPSPIDKKSYLKLLENSSNKAYQATMENYGAESNEN